jgi:1-acyl-sn-glycerol-3-phosphate acyltransferase
MDTSIPLAYRVSRWLLRTAMGFYFARIERFHRERVPGSGPLLFTSNHPNSVTDAFVIGASVPRKVNFVATVQLFRMGFVRAMLRKLGVIPINRMKDDPRAMRTVKDTFEACFRVLEAGEAVGIFPEGFTHDDPQLKTVKTGSARMALEIEDRYGGRLGLRIVPVGLTFSAKERYRSDVLVNFGEPIRVADFLQDYAQNRHACIERLTLEIKRRIESLVLHLPKLERARLVDAVRRLHLDRLRVGNRVIHEPVPPAAGDLILTQAIGKAVDFICEQQPDRAVVFTRDLDQYERWLRRLHVSDDELAGAPGKSRLFWRSGGWALLGVLLLPVAVYGWLHRFVPIRLLEWAVKRYAMLSVNKTHVSTTAILAGLVLFGAFYGICIVVVQAIFGFPASLWYGLSLPVASLTAHYCFREARRYVSGARCALVLLRAPAAARRLLAMRAQLIREIEAARWQVPVEALAPGGKAGP